MKITIETGNTKIYIEENAVTINELLDIFKRCAIAITYHEDTWYEAILDAADEINNVRSSQTTNK